jgi:glycosyltransferase involved in cell wall biosynthesis
MIQMVPQFARSILLDSRPLLDGRGGLRDARTCFDAREDAVVLDYLSEASSVTAVVHRSRSGASVRSWLTSYRAVQHVQRLRPDVVHLEDPTLRLAPLVWLLRRFPVVADTHDARVRRGEENWKVSLARGITLPLARRVIVHSEYCLKALRNDWPAVGARAEHVPLGVLNTFRGFSEGGRTLPAGATVLLLGRLAPYKGLDLLYAAAPLVAAQIPKVEFVIAGRPERGYRVPSSPPLPNGGAIRLIVEHVDTRTLARFYEQARVVVCPYAQATQSGVVLTAYAFGKPVVATDVGGIAEYVHDGKTGLLVPAGDPQALANAIVRVLSDQVLYSQLCAGIQEFAASDNAWERVAVRTLQVYEHAMRTGA